MPADPKTIQMPYYGTQGRMQYENALEPSIIRWYTDGSKLNGRTGASFYIECVPDCLTDQSFFHLGRINTVFQAKVFAIAEVAKKLIMERTVNEKIIILVDSQAAILAIQNNIVKSNVVLTCIKNLHILGKDKHVTIAWTPGHTGIQVTKRRISCLNQDQHKTAWGLNPSLQFHMPVVALQQKIGVLKDGGPLR